MKILIITKNWLGDILFEIPAIEMIRRTYPEAEILCLTHPRCREILELHPAVDRVIAFDEKTSSLFEKIRLIRSLRREKIDTAYFFHRSRTRAFLSFLGGVKNRVGYGIKKPNFLTQAFPEPPKALHHADYFAALLEQAGLPKPENTPVYSFHYTAEDARAVHSYTSEPFVCFHLGANWEPKRWPVENFAALADLIYQKWKFKIILTGGSGDKMLGEQVLSKIQRAQAVSLIGRTGLGELAALFASARFVISGDSGPMHIASGVGARVLALFGPTDPALTGPRGTGETIILSFVPPGYSAPWYGKEFPSEGWLGRITPEEVMRALESKNWGEISARFQAPAAFAKKTLKDAPRGVLINTLSNIGDVIMSTPVIMSLAKRYPRSRMTVIVGPRAKGILEGSVFIDRLVIYDKHASLFAKADFLKKLRKEKYEAAVDLKNSAIPFLVSAKKRSPLFRFFKKFSARDRHLEILEPMGLSVSGVPDFDFFSEAEKKSMLQKLKAKGDVSAGWIVMAPVAASENKTWPLESFGKVTEGLLKETPYTIVLAGGPREASLVEPLVKLNPSRVINMAGETTLREFAALIGGSELLIANDSSAAQLGFELNHRTAVIFGPTDPGKFAKEGECFRILRENLSCPSCKKSFRDEKHHTCLLELKPEKVLSACLELLEQPGVRTAYSQGTKSS